MDEGNNQENPIQHERIVLQSEIAKKTMIFWFHLLQLFLMLICNFEGKKSLSRNLHIFCFPYFFTNKDKKTKRKIAACDCVITVFFQTDEKSMVYTEEHILMIFEKEINSFGIVIFRCQLSIHLLTSVQYKCTSFVVTYFK